MNDMTYEQTVELERNIKIKNKAREIVEGFKKKVQLSLQTKKGLMFTLWSDEHNATYLAISENGMTFICDFLHENYSVDVNESCVFSGIKSAYRGIEHLASKAGVEYNPNNYKD
jgi:hypothetical protein